MGNTSTGITLGDFFFLIFLFCGYKLQREANSVL